MHPAEDDEHGANHDAVQKPNFFYVTHTRYYYYYYYYY